MFGLVPERYDRWLGLVPSTLITFRLGWYPIILFIGLVWYLSTLITIGLVWYPSILSIGLVWYLNGEGGDPFSVRIEHKLDDVITAEKGNRIMRV